VRLPEQFEEIDGLIIPGGETTTMTRIMKAEGWIEDLRAFGKAKPVFGTCAGLILMGSEVEDARVEPMGWLPIKVLRNAYGSQVWSFSDVGKVRGFLGHPEMEMVFIRAPKFEILSSEVEVIGECRGEAVMVKSGHHLASSFHPELTVDTRVHRYWLEGVESSRAERPVGLKEHRG
jgi:5'-phosphate synthase pdxT subunit